MSKRSGYPLVYLSNKTVSHKTHIGMCLRMSEYRTCSSSWLAHTKAVNSLPRHASIASEYWKSLISRCIPSGPFGLCLNLPCACKRSMSATSAATFVPNRCRRFCSDLCKPVMSSSRFLISFS